jgi:hypothetical protein
MDGVAARKWLLGEMRQLIEINPSDRPWQMPFAAALACGLPLVVGAVFGRMDFGVISSLAGMVFLYLPATALQHRMVWLMACAFGMIACYALGLISPFVPVLTMPTLVFITLLVTMGCRYYRVGPPGAMFFVMSAAVGAYSPTAVLDVPLKVGVFSMGCLLACLVAFFYSVAILRLRAPAPLAPLAPVSFDFVVFDPVVIAAFVGVALVLAQVLDLERPYWVPLSCLAVIQGMSLRAVWTRQMHRVGGTFIGLGLTWVLLALPLDKWSVALMVIALTFIVESAVVRHYGFAVIFITPLTIFLAEAATLGQGTPTSVIEARFVDTVLGSVVGFAGGYCLHNPGFRAVVGRQLRRLRPDP